MLTREQGYTHPDGELERGLWGQRVDHGEPHLLLHDGHGGPRQQEGLERHQVPERVLHLVAAGDDVGPGLADGAEEDRPGRGDEDGVVTQDQGRGRGAL